MITVRKSSRPTATCWDAPSRNTRACAAQARTWEAATGRLLDQVGLAPGRACLDAGCGPGETMRLLAQRVGPAGHVIGRRHRRPPSAARAMAALHGAGHHQCRFAAVDMTSDDTIPGAPFDLVCARLLLIHLPDPVAALRRLWDAVAPGGHLVMQDYDLHSDRGDAPARHDQRAQARRDRDLRPGGAPPAISAAASRSCSPGRIGAPDGTDVAGRLSARGRAALDDVALIAACCPRPSRTASPRPRRATAWLQSLADDARREPDRPCSGRS